MVDLSLKRGHIISRQTNNLHSTFVLLIVLEPFSGS